MKRVFADTSAWFSYVRRDDPDHAAVKRALEEWEGRLITSDFVFDEVVTLAQARLGHAAAVRVGEALLDSSIVEMVRVSSEDLEDAWEWFKRHRDKAYSFTDCTTFTLMRRLRIDTALATDRHFQQAGFEVRPRMES
ncbi:MAG: type II toxin-antitoxin system VapC family toxin [Elusimicrobia bacterium]|nr:type II toxin-antitoxin system VapC family toxin [Elusimicrobiota bacterium]